jgi:murein DD-endopeptidase MepM/ murein hydrolase activator NlpD
MLAVLLALGAVVALRALGRSVLRLLRVTRRRFGGQRRAGPGRPNLALGVGLLVLIAVAGPPSRRDGSPGTSPPAQASAAAPKEVGLLPALEPSADVSPPPGAAATAPTDSPAWRHLLDIEGVIVSYPQAVSSPGDGLAAALAAEEQLYEDAVRTPATGDSLVAAAAATGDAEAITAVGNDLVLVRSMLANQAAADRAAAALVLLDPKAPSQCVAGADPRTLAWPIQGSITQPFGPSTLSFEPARTVGSVTFAHFHTGLDITAPLGTPVHAAAAGLISFAGAQADAAGQLVGYGNYVVINHPSGCTTLYGHLSARSVEVGDQVAQGQVIGEEGSTGSSTGPHLHFEVRVDGQPVDPALYLP